MDPGKKGKIKDAAPTIGAVVISVATAVAGVAGWLENLEKARRAEHYRIAADEAIAEKQTTQDAQLMELRIRVGVLEKLVAQGAPISTGASMMDLSAVGRGWDAREGIGYEEPPADEEAEPSNEEGGGEIFQLLRQKAY